MGDVDWFVFQAVATYHLAGPITTCRTVHIYNSWYCRFRIMAAMSVTRVGILSTFHTLEFAISFCLDGENLFGGTIPASPKGQFMNLPSFLFPGLAQTLSQLLNLIK